MTLTPLQRIDRDLALKTRALDQATQKLDYTMASALAEDIDNLLDQRTEHTQEEKP